MKFDLINLAVGIILGSVGAVFVLRNNPTLLAKLISNAASLEALYAKAKTKLGVNK